MALKDLAAQARVEVKPWVNAANDVRCCVRGMVVSDDNFGGFQSLGKHGFDSLSDKGNPFRTGMITVIDAIHRDSKLGSICSHSSPDLR